MPDHDREDHAKITSAAEAHEPSAAIGAPTGLNAPPPTGQPARAPGGASAAPPPGPPSAPEPNRGQPGAERWPACTRCGSTDPPDERGRCRTTNCRSFRVGNIAGEKPKLSPKQRERVAKIEAEMIAERGGPRAIDVVTRDWIAEYATLTVHIATHDEHGALTTRATERRSALAKRRDEVAARIRLDPANRPAPSVSVGDPSTADIVARLEVLLAQAKEQLAFESRPRTPVTEPKSSPIVERAPVSLAAEPDPCGPEIAPEETTCAYGCGSLERCAELKRTRPDAWEALHYTDPEEVKRRDAQAAIRHHLG